jgi:SagB-type dehydrogenase family enzyme
MDMPTLDAVHEIQTVESLVIVPLPDQDDGQVGIYEFISKSFARCPINTLYWLSYFKQPKSLNKAFFEHSNLPKDSIRLEINSLLDAKFLTTAGGNRGNVADLFASNWEWDISTALYHFTVQDNPIMSDCDARQKQIDRLATEPPPTFWWRATQQEQVQVLVNEKDTNNSLLQVMRRRRTNRTSTQGSLELAKIAKCLYAGLGLVGTIKATSGDVPLSMTPSGGARNPYEAFAIVRKCNGIDPGIYHYCAAEQILERVDAFDPKTSISDFFGQQEWLDGMAVVIVLVAVFERTMWKYQDPNAYRVLLIEAGHIGQNIMLMATEQGYTACPTAAMAHSKVSDLLRLKNKLLHAPIYALSLDEALPSEIQIQPLPARSAPLGKLAASSSIPSP